MHNKKKSNDNFKYFVLIIVFILTVLFCFTVYSVKTNRKLTFIESAIKDSALYVGKIIYTPFEFVKDRITDLNELIDIKNKYNKLLKDQEKIDAYKQEIENLKKEIEELKVITELEDIRSLYDIKNATVIARDYNAFYNTLTINLGSINGIKEGMAVTSKGILIGKIENVSNFTSDVKLLTTDTLENKISVEMNIDSNYVYGLLTRYDKQDNTYIIEVVSDIDSIPEGTKILTSGLSEVMPSGIVIGEVTSLSKDNFDLTRILKVKPSIDFSNINYVNIIVREEK